MISQTTEYALRAIVDLAFHAGRARTTQQVAEATHVPVGYLAKILKDLAKQGIVRAQRGPNGGFTLERDPGKLSLYDVIAVVDPPKRIRSCPLDLPAHRVQLCPLHARLDEAMAMIERVFRETTIADVTADPEHAPLDGHPRRRAKLTVSGGLAPHGGAGGRTAKSPGKAGGKRRSDG